MFEPRNRRELSNFAQSRSRSRRENFSSVRDLARSLIETNTHPAHLPTPQRILIWCVGALLGAHVLTKSRSQTRRVRLSPRFTALAR
jgi:hypothetical protein